MLIKCCEKCPGRPYTTILSETHCPNCNSELTSEFLSSEALVNRPLLLSGKIAEDVTPNGSLFENDSSTGTNTSASSNNNFSINPNHNTGIPVQGTASAVVSMQNNSTGQTANAKLGKRKGSTTLTGVVTQYSSSGREDGMRRRLLINKVIDALVYHQRIEDLTHRFVLRVDYGKDAMGLPQNAYIPVNVYGTIASGMNIADGSELEVSGKYRDGILLASKIYTVNNGYKSQIKFQHAVSTIVSSVLLLIALIVMIAFAANSSGGFFEYLKKFAIAWLVFFVVFSVLYLVFVVTKVGIAIRLASNKGMKFPLIGVLLLSFLFALGFMCLVGTGVTLSGMLISLLNAVLPSVIIIAVIVFLFWGIFKIFFGK